MDFRDKVALITGAGAGIGRKTACLLAARGAKVAINDLPNSPGGQETLRLVQAAGGTGIFVGGDVSRVLDAERMVGETVAAFGKIDILVNNAGIVLPGRVDNTSEDDFDRTMRVNVKGAFLVAKYATLEMKKAGGGAIVNIASVAALKGITDRAAYCASKGALVSLTRAMAADYLKDNIRVNCVCPGTTLTPSLEDRIQAHPDPSAMRAEFISRQPMGRLGRDEEIAQAVLFACCDEAAFMNGSIVSIDGGSLL
ncbi:MAG: glucose 1-dehydrogenase [Firmicutes bacterium]|nr:glucose 1-dehydrogenase [Dethiobacter sp.]MBS3888062.1 glucose 1-dehydrogenase [Bacillota bacterium]MBS4055220.1 glucose 1-dehydrogenase [Thermaerobacter sp.]MBS4055519.1 glucose 1-dehydrogenase [Thermaerobacter sp.]